MRYRLNTRRHAAVRVTPCRDQPLSVIPVPQPVDPNGVAAGRVNKLPVAQCQANVDNSLSRGFGAEEHRVTWHKRRCRPVVARWYRDAYL
jgi:hypothetical protein